jgi:flagellar biosynthesis/type III secretory pathway M-ring protein FliF/YscJ
VTLTADVTLLPSGVDTELSRELIALLERDPEQVAAQLRAWMAEEQA